jgi:hypothetical protein
MHPSLGSALSLLPQPSFPLSPPLLHKTAKQPLHQSIAPPPCSSSMQQHRRTMQIFDPSIHHVQHDHGRNYAQRRQHTTTFGDVKSAEKPFSEPGSGGSDSRRISFKVSGSYPFCSPLSELLLPLLLTVIHLDRLVGWA